MIPFQLYPSTSSSKHIFMHIIKILSIYTLLIHNYPFCFYVFSRPRTRPSITRSLLRTHTMSCSLHFVSFPFSTATIAGWLWQSSSRCLTLFSTLDLLPPQCPARRESTTRGIESSACTMPNLTIIYLWCTVHHNLLPPQCLSLVRIYPWCMMSCLYNA